MRRRLLFILVALLIGVGLTVATLPWWLGSAARWAGSSRGLTFATYERIGYGRFALGNVEYRHPTVRVTVSRLEVDTPVLWGWRHLRGKDSTVIAGTWRVEVLASKTPSKPKADRGWMALRALLQRIATQLDRWLPRASTGAGSVRFPGGEIAAEGAQWSGRALTARGLSYRAIKADATLSFADPAGALLLTAATTGEAVVPARIKAESRDTALAADLTLWEQPAKLAATFGPRGWRPAAAKLDAREWSVPAEKWKLGAHYARVTGRAQIEWSEERIQAEVEARGEPIPGKPAPPLALTLRGAGDFTAFTVAALEATLPGISARLSNPVTIERGGKIRESAAQFVVDADLAIHPWFAGTGFARGEARLVSGLTASPSVEFSLEARDVKARDVNLAAVNARGRLDWPRLQITEGSLIAGGGERLTWSGGWDFQAREVLAATMTGEVRRASVARWLPAQPEFDVIDVQARASGPLARVQHGGRATISKLTARGINPVSLTVEWRGAGAGFEHVSAEAAAGVSRITLAGSADQNAATVTAMEFTQQGAIRLKLAAPARVQWRPQLQLDGLHLAEGKASLKASATGGETGRVEVSAREIASRWFSDFVPESGPPWHLNLLALLGSWDRGPMKFSLSAGATLEIGEGRSAAVMASARGDENGLTIEALRATEGDATVVNAVGQLPITLTPGRAPLVHIVADGPVSLDATVAPNAAFWQKLAVVTGVELQDPAASVHLTGTWQRPEGTAQLKAARIVIDPKRVSRPLPVIEALDVQLSGDRGGVTLNTFALQVEGQPVRAHGRLPLPDGNWGELFKAPVAAARRGADLRLEVPEAEVAVFARFLPTVLAPQGRFQADLTYRNGGVEGFVKLRDAASRPLGPLGVLQEISADIALAGRKMALRGVTARSGGQPVTLSGTIELLENETPRYDLTLKGENLPFVRQTGLLLRGDLDLKLQSPANAPPRLSGSVRLRDSLFLADVRAFLPKGGGASPSRRPPYFSVDTPPINAWNLAVDVTGEKFLRLRTTVFAGVASARFRLGGTMGEPRAIGEAVIDEGTVRMPFASFAVTQGAVRLTEADPYSPAVYLRATGRRYGYDLAMEIDGDATQPNVVFTSSPALDAEQVLLMVMTGAVPTNEISRSTMHRAANIGLYLGQSLLGSFGADAADADRLTFVAGEKISDQGKETYNIEYRLSDRWTVTGERNEFDELNAGLKWRLFGGKKPRTESSDEKK